MGSQLKLRPRGFAGNVLGFGLQDAVGSTVLGLGRVRGRFLCRASEVGVLGAGIQHRTRHLAEQMNPD